MKLKGFHRKPPSILATDSPGYGRLVRSIKRRPQTTLAIASNKFIPNVLLPIFNGKQNTGGMRKMDSVRLFLVSAIAISLVGCSSFTSPARYHLLEEGKPYWLDYSAERRGTIIIPKNANNNITVCAEPSPDVALDIVDRFKADVGTGKLTVGAEMDVEEKVIQLAKRTQTIMFLRESLYRLCELSLNYQLDETQVRELYEKVIATAGKMADAELVNAQQSKIEAETRKLEVMQKTPALIDEYVKGLKNK